MTFQDILDSLISAKKSYAGKSVKGKPYIQWLATNKFFELYKGDQNKGYIREYLGFSPFKCEKRGWVVTYWGDDIKAELPSYEIATKLYLLQQVDIWQEAYTVESAYSNAKHGNGVTETPELKEATYWLDRYTKELKQFEEVDVSAYQNKKKPTKELTFSKLKSLVLTFAFDKHKEGRKV